MTVAIRSIARLGASEIWQVQLDVAMALDKLPALSDAEEARAQRLVFARDRARYRSAHRALRQLLSAHAGVPPHLVQWSTSPFGKPQMCDVAGVEFNLSHSQNVALVAIGSRPVGIDVEVIRPIDGVADIAKACFSTRERQALSALPAGKCLSAFFVCWTRKEACVKALGLGLSIDIRSLEVGTDSMATACKVDAGVHGVLSLRSLPMDDGLVAAVAFLDADVPARAMNSRCVEEWP